MANQTQFGTPNGPCAECEEMLADALDGTLSPGDQAAFDRHIASCVPCSEMLADAQRGAAWLELLRTPRPEPSAPLLERILSQTTELPSLELVPQSLPFLPSPPARGAVLPFRSRVAAFSQTAGQHLRQPRLIMTAAMAFFSIALTINFAGIRLNELHASSLSASSLSRSFSDVRGQAVRYYDNLPVVYELESSVNDLQKAPDEKPQPPNKPFQDEDLTPQGNLLAPEPRRETNPGISHRQIPNLVPNRRTQAAPKGGVA